MHNYLLPVHAHGNVRVLLRSEMRNGPGKICDVIGNQTPRSAVYGSKMALDKETMFHSTYRCH